MSPDLVKQFIDAFSNKGVAILKTEWKMRYRGGMGVLIEPSDGSEPILPIYWKQGVYVVNSQDVFTWIGKRVRQDQLGVKIDFNLYNDAEDGWEIKKSEVE